MFRSNSMQKNQSTMASPPFLRSSSSTSSLPSASSSTGIRKVSSTTREGTTKATINDHISQAVQSTSNLLQLMQQSSPSQAHLLKLPKNLLAKTATIKNTSQGRKQVLAAMIQWIISKEFERFSKAIRRLNLGMNW